MTLRAVPAEATARVPAATIKMWTYLSKHLIQAAAQFARLSCRSEKRHKGRASTAPLVEHRGYVMASIFMAVSFLEATINELFALAVDGRLSQLKADVTASMAGVWRLTGQRRPTFGTLDKFDLALILAKKQPFNKGALPYQDVQLLVSLRNALVHYEPEWVMAGSETDPHVAVHELGKKLRAKKFTLNPFAARGNPFYPDKCLSHGCAKWAVESSVKFADEFFSRMGLRPTYDDVRSGLKTE